MVLILARYRALANHPDKTAMGRVERGFDFLGYILNCKESVWQPRRWPILPAKLSGFMSKSRPTEG
jgi:hypothetical protein